MQGFVGLIWLINGSPKMKNKIRVKQDAATLDHYFDMEDFKSMFDDISEIAYYEIKATKKEYITVTFFDKNKKLVIPKELK